MRTWVITYIILNDHLCFPTAEFLSSLGQYEIAIPVRVGPHGEPLSEEETPHGHGRQRRSTEDPQLYYQLSTPSADLLLNLTLQGGLLSREFRVEYWKKGHVAWSHPYLPNCHYVGHLQHQPHSSSVALSNCNGLVSSFVTVSQRMRCTSILTHPNPLMIESRHHISL